MASVQETIGCAEWVVENFVKLRDIFPPRRTQLTQQLILHLGFKMKCVGVDWRTQSEMGQAMVLCHHLGLYHQDVKGEGIWIERSERLMPAATFFHMSSAQITTNRLLRTTPPVDVVAQADEIIARIQLLSKTRGAG